MRLNKFIAAATELSRRKADEVIAAGRVTINGKPAVMGMDIQPGDEVTIDGRRTTPRVKTLTLMLNKPVGYVVSRNGQGSRTIYDLIPPDYHHLNPVGRLDKDSSGLLLLTSDGALAQELTHPSKQKRKIYEVTLDKQLSPSHRGILTTTGVPLEDGPSKFDVLTQQGEQDGLHWQAVLYEGRNRQIRRTFAALGYEVIKLHRTDFGDYSLGALATGKIKVL